MLVVRYVTLAALVVWLGGMIVVGALVAPAAFDVLGRDPQGREMAGELVAVVFQQLHLLAYACGALVFIGLFVMKFVGPPPAAFAPRAAIVAAMLASTAYSGLVVSPQIEAVARHKTPSEHAETLHQRSTILMAINLALGSVLLYWYARE